MIKRNILLSFLLLTLLFACGERPSTLAEDSTKTIAEDSLDLESDEVETPVWIFRQNGKITNAPLIRDVYKTMPLDTFDFPIITSKIVQALDNQLKLLDRTAPRRAQRIGNLTITPKQLEQTIKILRTWQQTKPLTLHQFLDAHQIRGEDRHGNVQFTGYFTPILKVDKKKSSNFPHAIYSRPSDWEGKLPTRRQIEVGNALKGKGLELAYAQNPVDVYYMHLQGSGFIEYPNGKREYLAYNGSNRHPYRSIEQYLMRNPELEATNFSIDGIRRFLRLNPHLVDSVLCYNPSYSFFTPRRMHPQGAGSVPLSDEISIAVDKRYIPLGSCLLASVPIYDVKKKRLRHEYRLLFAQDVGGKIRGPGHVDVYMGVGKQARRKASRLKHYGNLWLLLPKPENAVSVR